MELAAKVGYTSKAAISEIESGKKAPSMDMLQQLALILKVPVSVLVTPINFDGFDKKETFICRFYFLAIQDWRNTSTRHNSHHRKNRTRQTEIIFF